MPIMNCQELAAKLSVWQPDRSPTEIARLCLMIFTAVEDPSTLSEEAVLREAWRTVRFRMDAAADQHAAMAIELEQLCHDGPVRFSPDQIWTLLRAVKIQSQVLELYTDTPALV